MSKCSKCTLSTLSNRTVCLWGRGNKPAKIMIVGDSPDSQDNNKGIAFVGSKYNDLFGKAGMQGLCYYTYAVKCMPGYTKKTKKKIKKSERGACYDYLLSEFNEVKPQLVVFLGADAWKVAFEAASSVNEYRGRVYPHPDFGFVACTYSPKYIFTNQAYENLFINDMKNYIEFISTGRIAKVTYGGEVSVSDDAQEIEEAFREACLFPQVFSDVETSGLNYWEPGFRTTVYGAAWGKGRGIVFEPARHPELYAKFLQLPQVVHNATFEGGIYPRSTRIVGDTLVLSHLQNPLLPLGLETRANIHLGNVHWKGNELTLNDWKQRNRIDVDVTRCLHEMLTTSLDNARIHLHDRLVLPAAIIYAGIQARGIRLDVAHQQALDKELEDEAKQIRERLVREFGFPANGNVGSPEQVSNYLYKQLNIRVPPGALGEDSKFASTNADYLAELALDYPVCAVIRKYRETCKLRSNYIYRDSNGSLLQEIHPKFRVCGAVTIRPTSQDPPGQTFSRQKRVRRSYTNRRGILISGDLKQVELVVGGARIAADPTMVKVYTTGGDIHTETALAICGSGDDASRTKAKPLNFLLLYGGEARMLRLAALKQYGVLFSEEEAYRYRTMWLQKYLGVYQHHQNTAHELLQSGIVRSPLGQVWQLQEALSSDPRQQKEAVRKALNYPVQGTGALCCHCGLIELDKMDPGAAILTVHDQVVADVPLEGAKEFAIEWKRRWEAAIQEVYPHEVPIQVDMKMGSSLGELK